MVALATYMLYYVFGKPPNEASQQEQWDSLSVKCEYLFARAASHCHVAELDAVVRSGPSLDPIEVFDSVEVEGKVFRFVAYIVWLKSQAEAFEKYLRVKAARDSLWNKSVQRVGERYRDAQ